MEDTKLIYHIDEEETPYLMKIFVPPNKVTLGDLKNALNKPNYKYFFKSMDDDFGVVKEEITEDEVKLPFFNGRVIAWLVTADGSTQSDNQSTNDENQTDHLEDRGDATGTSRPPSFHGPQQQGSGGQRLGNSHTRRDTKDNTHDMIDDAAFEDRVAPLKNFRDYKQNTRLNKMYGGGSSGRPPPSAYDTSSSMMSSDLESTSFFDSEDESSRFSTTTGTTMSSKYDKHRKSRRKRRMPAISRASSFSSVTDSTMTLNIITVTLNMDTVNFLGISIVGQSDKGGDGGIYVGSIMKGGAVALDGRIEPGDMILEVNGSSFENMSNDEAVRVLREQVQKPGPITLVVAKSWDPNPQAYLSIPRQEPVRPIDPQAWVLHTNATLGGGGGAGPAGMPGVMQPPPPQHPHQIQHLANYRGPMIMSPSQQAPQVPPNESGGAAGGANDGQQSGSSSVTSSLPESDQRPSGVMLPSEYQLTVNSDMLTAVRALTQPDAGLEVRDRMWLKIHIPKAFIGSDLVDWLMTHVDGFADRRDARKYACNLLKCGYIRHTVNKVTFSEQCYYVFGDIAAAMSQMNLEDVDSASDVGTGPSAAADFNGGSAHPPGLPSWPPSYYPPPAMHFNPAQTPHFQGQTEQNNQFQLDLGPPSKPYNMTPAGGQSGHQNLPMRPHSPSVVSGSVVVNKCVCINSIKSLWETKKKMEQQQHQQQQQQQQNSGKPSIASHNHQHQHHKYLEETHQQQFLQRPSEKQHLVDIQPKFDASDPGWQLPFLPGAGAVSTTTPGSAFSPPPGVVTSAGPASVLTLPPPMGTKSFLETIHSTSEPSLSADGQKAEVGEEKQTSSGAEQSTAGDDAESTAPVKHSFLMCQ